MHTPSRSRGFTLIEILVVVLIIGIISAGVLLSVNLTGRDRELERESDRILNLVNYAREQAELQTREYGVIFHDDGYEFVAYDARRGHWRDVFEDDALRLRKLPDGLSFKLAVEGRPVVLVPTEDSQKKKKSPSGSTDKDKDSKPRSLQDIKDLKELASPVKKLEDDLDKGLGEEKPPVPQVTIFSNGDLTSFEITLMREGGVRSITLSEDEKGQFIAKPMVEART